MMFVMQPPRRRARPLRGLATLVLALAVQPQLPSVTHAIAHAVDGLETLHRHAHHGDHVDGHRHAPEPACAVERTCAHGHDVPEAPATPSLAAAPVRPILPEQAGAAALPFPAPAIALMAGCRVRPSFGAAPGAAAGPPAATALAPRAPPAPLLHA